MTGREEPLVVAQNNKAPLSTTARFANSDNHQESDDDDDDDDDGDGGGDDDDDDGDSNV